jgi:putative membrane-bound dehydrogenase-like protein
MPRLAHLSAAALVALQTLAAAADDLGIRVPEGFEVSLYADDALAHDIFSMTIDAKGRVVVAGLDYVKTLHDTDGDGVADRATLFSSLPKSGAHGMFFDGPDLVCTGDNAVMRLRDVDGDGAADGEPEIWTHLRHPEHGANGLVRGPDGCYYLICGNDAGITARHAALSTSPVKRPRCGGVVRISPGGEVLDVVAHGFRNPYDLDFDAFGRLFTVDADGERDHHLPWYAPNRLFDIAQGMEHGWMLPGWTRSWNRPQSFFDSVERTVEIGRGSPTGVIAYRHRRFPEHYRRGLFTACWTFGRVYYFPLEPAAASCRAPLETFMETTGDVGFAPCDLAVGPAGDLFVAIGGRRTRGSVFRVRYQRGAELRTPDAPLEQVLLADQPQSSWSRARWVPLARQLGAKAFEDAAGDEQLPALARLRAVEVLVELFGGLNPALAVRWSQASEPAVRARVAWALGRAVFTPPVLEILSRLTGDDDPAVQRAAWEALALAGRIDPDSPVQPNWSHGLASGVRRVRAAAISVARGVGRESFAEFAARVRIGSDAFLLRLAQLRIALVESDEIATAPSSAEQLTACLDIFIAATDPLARLEAVRLLQIGLGDLRIQEGQAEVYSGYLGNAAAALEPALRARLVESLAPAFPTGDDELDCELARLLGMLSADHPKLPAALPGKWTASSTVEDDIHYLIVASLLDGPRAGEVTAATARCLLALHAKLDAAGHIASRNWPFRVAETFAELCRRDPSLAAAVANHPGLNHVGHALFIEKLPIDLRQPATHKLWAATIGAGQAATSELIRLAGELAPEEMFALLRPQWDDGGLRDPIALCMARHPRPADRDKFIEALASPQPEVVEQAARALVTLGFAHSPADMAAALRALKQACALKDRDEPRRSLVRLLEFWTEDGADVEAADDPSRLYVGWFELFAAYYPAEAAGLQATSGADAATWKRRLAGVDWQTADAARGRALFEARACHRCHAVTGHLGPELAGAVTRMSRDDLFAAILDPSLEVSPAYLTTAVATTSGQVYHGLVVYESPESILLQTGPDTTVRITNAETSSVRPSTQSLMPTGLLDTFTDRDLSDLYAYLKSLAPK